MFYPIVVLLIFFEQCQGHGYLADPPARSSAWLFDSDFSSCCSYYDHMEMFCGGTYHQWVINGKENVFLLFFSHTKTSTGGKCSICGEPYDAKPHLLGVGDAMYLGKIVRTYLQGSIIPVIVVVRISETDILFFRLRRLFSSISS